MGIAWLTVPTTDRLAFAALVGYAAVVGVGIDVDHFLIARLNRRNWRAVRRCLDRPSIVLVDQGEIFEAGEVWPLQRLLSHVVIGGAAVGVLALASPLLAITTGVVLYAHLLADLIADNRQREGYARLAARYIDSEGSEH